MVMSPNVARCSVATGIIELIVAGICIMIGAAATATIREPAAWAGLWTFVYIIPGILVIIAGKQKNTIVMAVALGFNILATVIAVYILFASIALWIVASRCGSSRLSSTRVTREICSEKDNALGFAASVTIFAFILIITSFTGSILGCVGTCCNLPRDQTIAHTINLSQPSATVVISTQSSTQYPAHYNQQEMGSANPTWQAPPDYKNPSGPVYR